MNTTIQLLVENIDAATQWALSHQPVTRSAILVKGNSRYLRAAEKKAKKLGLQIYETDNLYSLNASLGQVPVIVDSDLSGPVCGLTKERDPDNLCLTHMGMSCVAEAVYLAMECSGLLGPQVCANIVLVGRGHAVKGLAERLMARDATVTVCHRKTKDIGAILKTADMVVYCADTVNNEVFQSLAVKEPVVFDVSGAVEKAGLAVFTTAQDLGKINISILMHRIVTGRR